MRHFSYCVSKHIFSPIVLSFADSTAGGLHLCVKLTYSWLSTHCFGLLFSLLVRWELVMICPPCHWFSICLHSLLTSYSKVFVFVIVSFRSVISTWFIFITSVCLLRFSIFFVCFKRMYNYWSTGLVAPSKSLSNNSSIDPNKLLHLGVPARPTW